MRIVSILLLSGLAALSACGDKDDGADSGPDGADGGDGTSGEDADGDGYTADEDCDDADASISPDADEVCDGVDNDCDSLVDDEDDSLDPTTASIFYGDRDGDGYGAADDAVTACVQPSGAADNAEDCDDDDPGAHPGAVEVCDDADTDEDCDGLADDADGSVDPSTQRLWYSDGDGDGYGDPGSGGTQACDGSSGAVANDTDCDDSDGAIHPGATEQRQDGIDDDCDGEDAPYILSDLGAGDLVLTEILQNPLASDDEHGEWFEARNASGGEVDLDGLSVWDLGTDGFTVAGGLRVADGGFVVLGRSGDTSLNGGVAVYYAYSGMALGNTDDELYLADGGATSHAVVYDSVAWDDAGAFPIPNGASMALHPTGTDATANDDGQHWCEASSTFGDGDRGTPGADNDSCETVFGPGASAGSSHGSYGANYMLGQQVTLTQSIVLTGFGAEVYSGTPDLYAALYTDSGGAPRARVAYTALTSLSVGDNELSVSGGAVSVAAGTYWLVINGGPINYFMVEDSSGSVTTWFDYSSHTSTPPATASSINTISYDQIAAWLIGY